MGERSSRTREQARAVTIAHQVIGAYVEVATEILPTFFTADCCLNGTRVAIEALDAFGIPAEPVPCRMLVTNKIANALIEAAQGEPQTDETLRAWKASGAWMIAIDGVVDAHEQAIAAGVAIIRQGYGRHLVCTAAGMMIDSAFRQFHRPQHGIDAPPVIVGPLGSSFLRDGTQMVEGLNGERALYMRDNEEVSYRGVPGFQKSEHNLRVASMVIQAMRAVLK